MANSKYEYVKQFETCEKCLKNTWIVVRLDGRSFHRFADVHRLEKPNDYRCTSLMTRCAREVMQEFSDIVLSYGQSDEFRKLATCMASYFSSAFIFHWSKHFQDVPMQYPISFDGRAVCYPTAENLRDYLSWRQADCHINNLYNTVFWSLVKTGLTGKAAQERLSGTVSSDKNEILFSECNINYSKEPEVARKGTTLIWEEVFEEVEIRLPASAPAAAVAAVAALQASNGALNGEEKDTPATKRRKRKQVVELHSDIIGESFWTDHPTLLER